MDKKKAEESKTLLDWLKNSYPDSSASHLRSWIKHGRVTVDSRLQRVPSLQVLAHQSIKVWPSCLQMDEGISILYEDPYLVVIDKPPGLLSVAKEVDNKASLHRFLKKRYHPHVVYVVHRLDRETSGLILFARQKKAFEKLKDSLKLREVKRQYLAVVEGRLSQETGTWQSRLSERPDFSVCVDEEKGETAITHYRVLKKGSNWSLLHLSLDTGKKHQLRVHCSSAGHPILGDKRYKSVRNPLKRLALHSYFLSFEHPITHKQMVFETPHPQSFLNFSI